MILLNGLLINLLFILILVLLANMFLWRKDRPFQFFYQKTHWFLIAAVQIIICLSLPVKMGDGFFYDLRFIPFLLGGLYGGKRVTLGLAALIIAIRFIIGGTGVWVTLILTITAAIMIVWMSSKFKEKSLSIKIVIVTAFSFTYSILAYLVPSFLYGFLDIKNFAIYSFILTLSTFFVAYLLEILRTTTVLQLEAIKYEKMEIVSHLAASISHEVRNPLTSVQGFLQLIHENEKANKSSKEYAHFALEETKRATGIINDYLTFAKPHVDEECVMKVEYEINKCRDIITPLALKHDVEIDTLFLHSGTILGDPHKFQQVLINICKNGIESMPNGGKLSILTTENNGRILLHITDTGVGMSSEHVARLGEPYFSLKEQKGTGLGMMVVFKIIESMGGTIKVTSELQVGTSITISLPAL